MATTKKTSIKKTPSKKDAIDNLSSSKQDGGILKKNGIDEMALRVNKICKKIKNRYS